MLHSFAPQNISCARDVRIGIAVYVQCALALTKTSPTGDSDMTFFIDGEQAGTFVKEAPGTPGYEYKVIVFSATGLQPQQHTLTIANGHVDGPKALILLDAIIYTSVVFSLTYLPSVHPESSVSMTISQMSLRPTNPFLVTLSAKPSAKAKFET